MNKRAERKQVIDAELDEEFIEFMTWNDQMLAEEFDWNLRFFYDTPDYERIYDDDERFF